MDSEESRLNRLKRVLYSRNEANILRDELTQTRRNGLSVPTSWNTSIYIKKSFKNFTNKSSSFFNKFLFVSLIFFFISLIVAGLIFFGGGNTISSNNVDIKVIAPSSISSGEELNIGLSVVNNNHADLEDVSLFIDYPEGIQAVNSNNLILSHDKIDLGIIKEGQSKNHTIRVALFGEKDIVKKFTLTLEYKVKGSNAIFSKEKIYEVIIGSSPILLNVVYPQEINSGQQITLSIGITSNSSVVLNDTLVKIEYPYGFTYKDSNQKPLSDNEVWNIGSLKNGEKKTLTITGMLVGQNMEERSFRISVGTEGANKSADFDTLLATSEVTIGIRKSFFDLTLLNPQKGIAGIGQKVPISINWQNTLPDKIINTHVEAVMSGNVFDRSGVITSNGGFYRSLDNTVLWDKNSIDKLATIMPGERGQVSFSLSSFPDLAQVRLIKNPQMNVHVVITGERIGTDTTTISSSADTVIKLESTLSVNSKSYRNSGPFNNTGPIPPRADVESTYTISWVLTNTTNDLKNTVISATLPAGVEWKNETSPSFEKVSYDSDTRTVSWDVGNVSFGTGFTYSPRTAYFKVGITPNLNQIGLMPIILSATDAQTIDTFTSTSIQAHSPSINTRYSDPSFKNSDAIVVE